MSTRPFLKWPGGKYRLIERISKALGPGERLVEPFVGSAAVFLNTQFDDYLLADNNPDLINLFQILNEEGESFIEYVGQLFRPETNQADAYYEYRKIFNSTPDLRLKAALFIYLNRHCYNGLCRYNKTGGFNSPFGRYKKPHFPVETMRHFVQKSQHATFQIANFIDTMHEASSGDIVYCDPPYMPLSKTASFTDYSAGGFGWNEQVQLAKSARQLADRGVRVIISNHNTPEVRKLYKGARISQFDVPRFISQDANNRTKAREILAIFST